MNLYLAQFKRGYVHTSVYLLRDRTDEGGNQSFGFYKADYSPRKAAIYLHNLTTILADKGTLAKPGQFDFAITNQPKTVQELLLQHSDGTFQLTVWGERLSGQDRVTVHLGVTRVSVRIYDPTTGIEPVKTLTNVGFARTYAQRPSNCHRDFAQQAMREPLSLYSRLLARR
jgi:hypothetical protein